MLTQNMDINITAGYRATTLYRAAGAGYENVVRLLLEKVARIDLPNAFDQTSLHRAADVGHLEVDRLLLEHGPDHELKGY